MTRTTEDTAVGAPVPVYPDLQGKVAPHTVLVERTRRVMPEEREDVAFLREALTDDFIAIGPLGFMLTRDQWLGRYEGGLSYDSFALDEVAARFYGGAAVATCRQSQAGEFQGNDVTGEFRATIIFAEQEGRWLLAGLHLSPIAGAPLFLNR